MQSARMMDSMPASGVVPMALKQKAVMREGIEASRHLTTFRSSNASVFTGLSNNVCRIEVASGQHLDLNQARLCVDLTNDCAAALGLKLDGGAHCIIKRLRVLSPKGVELERAESYNLLHNVLAEYTKDASTLAADSVLSGGPARQNDLPRFDPTAAGAAGTSVAQAQGLALSTNVVGANSTLILASAGGQGYDPSQCDSINQNVARHYEFPLYLGFFNIDTFLPPGASFILEITLDTPQASFVRSTANGNVTPSYKAENFELKIPAITVHDRSYEQRAAQMRESSGLVFRAMTFKHHVNTTPSGTGPDTLQIAERSQCLRAMVSVFRPQAFLEAPDKPTLTTKSVQYLNNYQYQVGSSLYPPAQVLITIPQAAGHTGTGTPDRTAATATSIGYMTQYRLVKPSTSNIRVSEAFAELQRAIGTWRSDGKGLIGVESYAQSENNAGAGCIGIDLSPYAAMDMCAGIDTASNNMPVSLRIDKTAATSGAAGAARQIQIDTFCFSEISFYLLPDGTMTSRS